MNKLTPGVKSTEFYVTLFTILLTVLNHKLGLKITPGDINSIIMLAMAYVGGRSFTKGKL